MDKSHSKKFKNKKTNKLKKTKIFRKNISKMKGGGQEENNLAKANPALTTSLAELREQTIVELTQRATPLPPPDDLRKLIIKKARERSLKGPIRQILIHLENIQTKEKQSKAEETHQASYKGKSSKKKQQHEIIDQTQPLNTPHLPEIFNFLHICDEYYNSQKPGQVITAAQYYQLFKQFELGLMEEKNKLALELKELSEILNKCMNIILKADNSNRKNDGSSYFTDFTWCFLQLLKNKFFLWNVATKNYEFNFNMKFSETKVLEENFNFGPDDIASFFKIYYKMIDMYNILTILSNILRRNKRQFLFYKWVPIIVSDLTSLPPLDTSDDIKKIPNGKKTMMKRITDNARILLQVKDNILLFFNRYKEMMSKKKLIPTNNFEWIKPKLFFMFNYLSEGKTQDEICNSSEYSIPKKASSKQASSKQALSKQASPEQASVNSNLVLRKEDKPILIGEDFLNTKEIILINLLNEDTPSQAAVPPSAKAAAAPPPASALERFRAFQAAAPPSANAAASASAAEAERFRAFLAAIKHLNSSTDAAPSASAASASAAASAASWGDESNT